MNRQVADEAAAHSSIPRTRGDEPVYRFRMEPTQAVFPAPAGMNRDDDDKVIGRARIPRTRGDEPNPTRFSRGSVKYSPHPRG